MNIISLTVNRKRSKEAKKSFQILTFMFPLMSNLTGANAVDPRTSAKKKSAVKKRNFKSQRFFYTTTIMTMTITIMIIEQTASPAYLETG